MCYMCAFATRVLAVDRIWLCAYAWSMRIDEFESRTPNWEFCVRWFVDEWRWSFLLHNLQYLYFTCVNRQDMQTNVCIISFMQSHQHPLLGMSIMNERCVMNACDFVFLFVRAHVSCVVVCIMSSFVCMIELFHSINDYVTSLIHHVIQYIHLMFHY